MALKKTPFILKQGSIGRRKNNYGHRKVRMVNGVSGDKWGSQSRGGWVTRLQ